MPEQTPHDEDRAPYSRTALARLVLSERAAGVATVATVLVSSRDDAETAFGGRAGEAATLVALAERALTAAVVYERERGATWAEIGAFLRLDPAAAEARFAADVAEWEQALAEPYRPDESGDLVPRLPNAARDPKAAGAWLDTWAAAHLLGQQEPHEVTGGLESGASAKRP